MADIFRAFGWRSRLVAFVLAAVALTLGLGRDVESATMAQPAPFRDGTVLVAFNNGTSTAETQAAAASVNGSDGRALGHGLHLFQVPNGQVLASVAALQHRPSVKYAEPDYAQVESAAPNDPSFGLLWGDQNTGQTVNGKTGTAGADDRAVTAWNVTTGSRSIVVAEVDSGVDYTHPDLAANVWTNPGGVGGCAAGTRGYNVLTSACDPMDDETVYGGHGTHVAGIIGAVGNNGIGVTGMNWQTTILPVKWLDSSGNGYTSDLITALNWVLQAKQAGVNVRVVNDSATFVGTAYSQALSDEIDLLGQNNILFVTAAGNTGDNNDDPSVGRYPCRYGRPNEICVTASNQNDTLPSWANYGATTVDLAAPGDNIYSTLRNGKYGYINGGSMAAGQVSGAAALVLSQRPSLSTADLKTDLLSTVDPIPALSGLVRTGGRLDVCAALQGCAAGPANTSAPAISGVAQQGQTMSVTLGSWTASPSNYTFQWFRCSGSSCASIGGATAQNYQPVLADVGSSLQASVTASNAGGSTTASSAQSPIVTPAGTVFGNATVGASVDAGTANWKRVVKFSLGQSASVSKLTIYLARYAAGQQVLRGVIYADNAGTPGALLATSNQVTFSSSATAGWYDIPLPNAVTLQPGTYWLGVILGATTNIVGLRYTSVASSSAVAQDTYSDGPSNPFGTPSRIDAEQLSIYATYSPAGAPSPPVNTALPTVTGTAQQGQTLSASQGTWNGGPTSYAYQWQRCDSSGANCANISLQTAQTYVLTGGDVGSTIRVSVTASNTAGSATATSAQTAVVTSAPAGGTFGTTTVGGKSDTILANRKRVNHYQLSVAGKVTKLSIYLQPTTTSGQQVLKGVIYADQGGVPGALLGVSNELTFKSTNTAGWYDLTFASPVALSAGTYWIGMISGSTSYVAAFRWTSVTGIRAYDANTYTSGPSNPFGTVNIDAEEMSLYATYTTS